MSDEQQAQQAAGQQSAPQGAVFTCPSCRHSQSLPEQLLGRQAKCPQCGQLGVVGRPVAELREPDVTDVLLDDLANADPSTALPRRPELSALSGPDSLALEAAQKPETLAGHVRHFFSGSLPVNLLSGLLCGVTQCLICLALALLVFSVTGLHDVFPHALFLTVFPAILGSVLFALHGRLAVAVGGPDPAVTLCTILLVAAVGSDLAGHAPGSVVLPTLLAALILAALVPGVLGILLSRTGLAERVRFLPSEVLGGMLAGFGLLIVKAWFVLMAASDPALARLFTLPAAEMVRVLTATSAVWGPAAGFGLLFFLVRMFTRGMVWPLLATALALGAWHLLVLKGYGGLPALTALAGRQVPLPQMLDLSHYLGFWKVSALLHIDWLVLAGRKEFFAAVAVVAVLPSVQRANILETVLARDAEPGEQMRLLGAANILSGLAGGLPSSLSLSGSLGLRALGATGPVAGFTVGLVCLAFVLRGQEALEFIPRFVPLGLLLATGLLVPVGWLLRDSRNPLSSLSDQRSGWACCLMVVVLGPVLGVFACLGLGLFLALTRAVSGGGIRFAQTGDVFHSNVDRSPSERRILKERGGQTLILRLQGYLFLGTLSALRQAIRARADAAAGLKYVILDFGAVSGLGASAANGLQRLEQLGQERGLLLLFTSVPLEMEEHMEGLGYRLGVEEGVCRVYQNLDYALEWCEDRILAEAGGLEQQQDTLEELLAATFPEPRLVPALIKCLERMEVPKKKHVIRQGDESDSLYFLQSGKVHVELALPGGKLLRLKKMGPGTVFGEMGLYTSAPRSASVIALERCVVYRLSAERFKLIQDKAPSLAAAVNRFIVTLLAERVAEENARNRAAQL